MVPLLWYDRRTPEGTMALSPLYAQGSTGERGWHTVLPLYYYDHRPDGAALFTLLGGYRQGDTTGWWALPILSGMYRRGNSGEFWYLAPLGRVSWSPGGNSHFFLPLYWHDQRQQLTASLLWTAWGPPERRRAIAPPLLSWYTRDAEERRFYALLGMYGHGWDNQRHQRDWLFPLWYWQAGGTFYSPLVGWNVDKGRATRYFLTPLIGTKQGQTEGSWFVPLYAYGRQRGKESSWWLWYSLLGYHQRNPGGTTSWFLPLYWYERWGHPEGRHGRWWWCPPITWYRHVSTPAPSRQELLTSKQSTSRVGKQDARDEVSQGCFPLWYYKRETRPEQSWRQRDFSLLFLLYDYHALTADQPQGPAKARDYVRHRVLWRLYHYERGDETISVDIVPGITYDKRPDGFRQFAFLWRFFRHANGPEGRQVDFLFIPVWR